MVKRKGTTKKGSSRTRTVYRTAPRRRRTTKTGYDKIAPAMATVALVAVNKDNIKNLANAVTNNGAAKISEMPSRLVGTTWGRQQLGKFVTTDQLMTDAVAVAGGYVAGELFNKFAPTVLKKPVAKISKKIPKVI